MCRREVSCLFVALLRKSCVRVCMPGVLSRHQKRGHTMLHCSYLIHNSKTKKYQSWCGAQPFWVASSNWDSTDGAQIHPSLSSSDSRHTVSATDRQRPTSQRRTGMPNPRCLLHTSFLLMRRRTNARSKALSCPPCSLRSKGRAAANSQSYWSKKGEWASTL